MEIKELEPEILERQKRISKIGDELGLKKTTPKLPNSTESIQDIRNSLNLQKK
ncbi:MAG: hypothetical protein Q7R97_01845 [Candidatus Daviesbacteria bacterium]|nr:hypothetical protein [Candidatus Daviesbacteria bacterium]